MSGNIFVSELTADIITNLYLYGTTTRPPNTESGMYDESLIRPEGAVTNVSVDINNYMDGGPGRFANPAFFEIIKQFFTGLVSIPDGGYDKNQMRDLLGLPIQFIDQQQWAYTDGKDDYAERVYIWNSVAFRLDDRTKFIVENGIRRIENFGIVPYSNINNTENFDLDSDDLAAILGNPLLGPRIDPSDIGRKVVISFEGERSVGTYTFEDYRASAQAAVMPSLFPLASLPTEMISLTRGLFENPGYSIRFLDGNNRPLLYGTIGQDSVDLSYVHGMTFAFTHPYLEPFTPFTGVTYVAGQGNDQITGTEYSDMLFGGSGNDTLDGAGGEDTLHGGLNDDTYILDEDSVTVVEKADEGTDTVKSDVTYTLSDNVENLELTGSGEISGTGNALDNIIKGNDENNAALSGLGGKDQIHGGDGDDTLIGGQGNDRLFGDDDDDMLFGEADDDYLAGGEGKDILLGGAGFDAYSADDDDTIIDNDATGQVFLHGGRLTGGTRKSTDPLNVYRDANTGTVYELNGTSLIVNGGLRINNFNNDDLGIHLETIPDDPPPPPPGGPDMDPAERRTSPIVVDLDGDGVETQALRYDRFFDHDANGMRETTAWVGSDDGLLVRDLNGNGRIDNGRELFGTNTQLQNGQLAANGYDALTELDSNQDGVVNATDAAFSQLRIWRDANSNGVTDADELLTLWQAGIASFNTQWTASTTVDANGQLHAQIGTATRTDGTTVATSDVWFKVDTTHRINALPLAENWRDVLDLPDAKAFGNLPDLHQAMATDPVLKGLVEAFVAEQDPLLRDAMLEGLIFQWAGVANVNPGSRDPTRVYGHVMDARQLIVLETLSGRGYEGTWCWGERDPNPHGNAAPLLIAEFKKFEGYVRAQLLAQIDPANYSFIRAGFSSGYSKPIVNWQEFQSIADALHATGDMAKMAEIIAVLRGLGTYSEQFRIETDQAFATMLIHHPDHPELFDLSFLYGSVSHDSLFGGPSGQVILADQGDDLVFGGAGNDSYFYRVGDGKDRIYDSAGIDQLVFMEGIAASDIAVTRDLTSIVFKISAGASAGEVRIDNIFDENGNLREGVIESIKLNDGTVWTLQDVLSQIPAAITSGDDSVYGTIGNDTIAALDGDDLLLGLGGNDVLNGQGGNDMLVGGNGDDTLNGGVGNDTLNGGAGNDTYVFAAGFGQDVIENYDDQGQRLDKIEFAVGISVADVTAKRVGNDLLLLLANGDSVTVVRHFDADGTSQYSINEVRFSDGIVWNTAALNAKVLEGTAGDDTLVGFASDDIVTGVDGNDVIDGADGNDTLSDGAGNDVLRGGDGNDTIYFNAGAEPGGSDVAAGGAGDDVYYVARNSGTDRITGLADSNAGTDRVVLSDITTSMVRDYRVSGSDLYLFLGESGSGVIENTIILEGFLQYNAPSHVIEFAGGTTMTKANFATSYWYGTAGDDVNAGSFSPDDMDGGSGNDTLSGGLGGDTIRGGEGDDVIHGNTGSDILDGGAGENLVYGDEGDDLFKTSSGQFFGGVGNDTYEFISQNQTPYHQIYTSSQATEIAGEGTDTVVTNYYNFTLSSTSVENLVVKLLNYHWFSSDYSISYDRKITGNDLDNTITITGFSSQPGWRIVVDGGLGNDTLIGSVGDEVYVLDSAGDTVIEPESSTSNDTVRAAFSFSLENRPNIENIELTANDTTATGNAGNNRLDGSMAAGTNTLIGGAGDDTYIIDSNDIVVEQAGGGTDTVVIKKFAPGTTVFTAPSGASQIEVYQLHKDAGTGVGIMGSDGNDLLIGNDRANSLNGGAGDDVLRSGGSEFQRSDSLNGGDGNDLLISDSGYHANLNGGAGNDELRIGDGTTSESIRYDRGGGSDVIVSHGGGFSRGNCSLTFGPDINPDNAIWSRDGNDLVITFSDSAGDQVRVKDYWKQENGVDVLTSVVDTFGFWNEPFHRSGQTLEALRNKPPVCNYSTLDASAPTGQAFTYTLPLDAFSDESVETLVYSMDGLPEWLSFDPVTRTLQGTPPAGQADQYYQVTATDIHGATTNLTLHVSFVNVIQGTSGNDSLAGTSGVDMLIGLAGNDTLNGGAGADHMVGGAGNDTYIVDHWEEKVVEQSGEGDDLVNASVSYALSENVERLTLTGSATEGAGNELDNIITGNSAANSLYGNEGNDTLTGNNGNDELYGGSGNDTLDGGSGDDDMFGEEGDDIYIVGSAGDQVEEGEFSGTDTVRSSITYTLGSEVEHLVLTGSSGLTGNGNELDNVLVGNSGTNTLRGYAGNDTLDGDTGNDTMLGGTGNDTYVVNATGDVVTELASEGTDLVQSAVTYTLGNNVEHLTLTGTSAINGTGNTLDNVLTGNAGKNTLTGGNGNDTLDGGAGTDTLTGGTGKDSYVMARGYGADTVIENDAAAGQLDVARFLTGVSYDQLWFARPSGSNNLEITIIGTSDKLTIKDWYKGSQYRVEEIRTADGNMVLTAAKVQVLVTAMASLTTPAMGQTTLSAAYQTQLASVFASTWTSGGQGLRAGGEYQAELMAAKGATTAALSEGTTAGIMAGGCLPTPRQDRVADWVADIGDRANEGRLQTWLAKHGYDSIEDWLQSDARPELPFGRLLDRFRDRQYTDVPTGDTPAMERPWVVGGVLPRPELVDGQAMQEWPSMLDQNSQTGVDALYQSLVERYAQERVSQSNSVLGAPMPNRDLHADVASNYQRLISAMSLAGAGESSLAASCQVRRDGLNVETSWM